jgi:hypothetical protein
MDQPPALPRRLALMLSICSFLQGCGGPTGKDREAFMPISSAIARAPSAALYEGLPHPNYEPDLLKQELDAKQTIQIGEFPFYERPLPITAEDIKILRQLATAAGNFSSYAGAKACGGFHPDYSVVWKDGDATYEMLICFGCRDAMFYGPTQKLLVEIRRETFERFKVTLEKYHDQRPEPRYGMASTP